MKSILYSARRSPRLVKMCVIVLSIIATAFVLYWTPQVKATLRSVGFVAQVLPTVPVKPSEWFTATPERREISYPLDDGSTGIADLYIPASGGEHSALLFFLGVNPAGKDDERVVNLGNAVARTGIVVRRAAPKEKGRRPGPPPLCQLDAPGPRPRKGCSPQGRRRSGRRASKPSKPARLGDG